MELNNLINERIGLGKFQIYAFVILSLAAMNNGVELILSSFLNPIIKRVFPDITPRIVELLASIYYVGIMMGSLTSGVLADKYGRKRLITSGAILQISINILFYYANDLEMLLLLRFCSGFAYGFSVPVPTSMFAEISPTKYRGKGILLLNFIISFGKISGVLLGYIFLRTDLAETNWKLMIACGGMLNIFVIFGSIFVLEESPRFLLANHQIGKGLVVLEKMLYRNGQKPMTAKQIQGIQAQYKIQTAGKQASNNSFLSLLRIRKVIALVLCWTIINFCFEGMLVIEAFHLSNNTSSLNLTKYFFAVAGEIPSLFVSLYLIDHPKFGRKKSLILFFLCSSICHLAFAQTELSFLIFFSRLFMKSVFQILYPLTTQSFDTNSRTKGFGMCSGGGRIGAILMPFVVMPLDRWWRESVYMLFSGLSLIAAFVGYSMVEETMQVKADEKKHKKQ